MDNTFLNVENGDSLIAKMMMSIWELMFNGHLCAKGISKYVS